jgi:hypothetical protein
VELVGYGTAEERVGLRGAHEIGRAMETRNEVVRKREMGKGIAEEVKES